MCILTAKAHHIFPKVTALEFAQTWIIPTHIILASHIAWYIDEYTLLSTNERQKAISA